MPHAAVRIHSSGIRNDFGDGEVNIMSVAYSYSDSTISSKCTMNLP
jgi:hypothetical protein